MAESAPESAVPQVPPWRSGDFTVADLLAVPHLSLELVAGQGGVDRQISWSHVCELVDPGPWLDGGELLIVNGFGVPETATDQVSYLDRLFKYRVTALALGGHAPALTPEMLDRADELSFPIVHVPREIPHLSLSHMVAGANLSSTNHRLLRDLQLFDALRLRGGRKASAKELMADLEKVSGYQLALVTPARLPLLDDWPWVPDPMWFLPGARGSDDILTIEGGYAIPISVGDRVAAYLVGMFDRLRDAAGLTHLRRCAVIVALEAVAELERREARRREGRDLLADVLTGRTLDSELEHRLAAHGLQLSDGLNVVVLRGADGEVDLDGMHHWLSDRRQPHLLVDDGDVVTLVARSSSVLAPLVLQFDLHGGVARADAGVGLLEARQYAMAALLRAWGSSSSALLHADEADAVVPMPSTSLEPGSISDLTKDDRDASG